MGSKYEVLAAKYPFQGYYEQSYRCDNLDDAIQRLKEFQAVGYDIINLYCRDIKELEHEKIL